MQNYHLSPEKMLEIGKEFEDLILANLSVEKRLAGLRPEERLIGLRPEERLIGLRPEDILDNLSAEDIMAYLKKKRRLDSLQGGLNEAKADPDPSGAGVVD